MYSNFKKALAAAKRQVIATGRSNVFAFVCRDSEEDSTIGFSVYSQGFYDEDPSLERNCVAAVWSYPDGRYDENNQFHENGKIAAAEELYDL